MKFVEQSGSMRHTASYGYDLLNNLTTMTETFNGEKRTTGYTYDDDNRVTSVETAAGTEYYTYDEYGRLSQIVTKKGGVEILTKTYTYQGDGNDKPTARVNTMSVTGGGYDKTYRYYYDKNDNLISVSDSTHSTSYYYDSANQLVRENNQTGNLTKGWTYDNAGNILYSREYPYDTGTVGTPQKTNTYTYGDTNWGDKLTAYNGQTITYDAIGNPLSDGTWSYTWEHGREMASMSKNSALVITKQPEDCFCELGGTASLTVAATGTVVTTYLYDAWGNHLHVTGSLSATVGRYNPLRYRGYVYDRETNLYYLQSRYYNPETGRFINGDAIVGTNDLWDDNLFAYCDNDPINKVDFTGFDGKYIDLGRGWRYRIDTETTSVSRRHIHVENQSKGLKYMQNDDGSPHDKGKGGKGKIPKWLNNKLIQKAGWDYNGKREKFYDKTEVSAGDSDVGYCFADGVVRRSGYMLGGRISSSTDALENIYWGNVTSVASPSTSPGAVYTYIRVHSFTSLLVWFWLSAYTNLCIGRFLMRYFLKELWCDSNHPDPVIRKNASLQWEKNAQRYYEYFKTIQHRLSKRFRTAYLQHHGFHDYPIRSISFYTKKGHQCVFSSWWMVNIPYL